jgi:hypothetical protein
MATLSSEKADEAQLHSIDGLVLTSHDCPHPSPSRFKSLVKNLRQKLHSEVAPPAHINEEDTILQQTIDDVACLSRLLRISESNLADERASSNEAQTKIQDMQQQLHALANDLIAQRHAASQQVSQLDRLQQHNTELESDNSTLRDALCKSETYRKEYAKSKKSELLDMQAKLDAAAAEACAQDAAHQRTRSLLLSEVETRAETVRAMQRLESSHAELQVQYVKLQELCSSQEKQLQVLLVVHTSCDV